MRRIVEEKDFDAVKRLLSADYEIEDVADMSGWCVATVKKISRCDGYFEYQGLNRAGRVGRESPKRFYVISSSVFESLEEAREQLLDWHSGGTLDEGARVFAVEDVFHPVVTVDIALE